MSPVTRFAPSPTGPLHLGHAYAAWVAHKRAADGRFLLRIEDIDQTRSRPHWLEMIYEDLTWLGLIWREPVMVQSERLAVYASVLDQLWGEGLLYACSCRRRDILAALSAPQEGVPLGPDGVIYPGTCRGKPQPKHRPKDAALRLNMRAVLSRFGLPHPWIETGVDAGPHPLSEALFIDKIGDVVLARRDFGTSYHLSVVVDDAAQGITEVTRGADLAEATPIHALLFHILGLPVPSWHHHALVRDEAGKRLAKRDDARAIREYRARGFTPDDVLTLAMRRADAGSPGVD